MSPNLTVDPTLPIAAHQAEIAALMLGHQVVIVAGETGSGKTTQLPKIALALGRGHVGHTQPRRIAARAVASRIAQETGTALGDLVGYQVRFTAATTRETRLKLMTDGIMLAEIAHDTQLRRYDTIIIDEAHERSLNIDFLLGYLKQLLPQRPDLKVVITSATIDTARFSWHFGGAPVVEVSGRGYPIEVRYAPPGDTDQPDAIVRALRTLPPGDNTLVFLAGEREIRDTAAAIEAARLRDTHVLPLYARLTPDEQARVFAPHEGRRVVLATNVAETSLTVPGIRAVIDPGFARIARYSARAKVQRLPIEPISRASADQRAGRCGRVAPGVCVRLYSEDDYLGRPAFTEPEILRTSLASVILAMAQAGLGAVEDFPFVDAPDRRRIDEGMRLLHELGAIRPDMRLTRVGRRLAQFPIDPALARIIVEGDARGALREAVVIAAGISVPDVRERPHDHREAADAMHARFASDAALTAVPAPTKPAPAEQAATPAGPARVTVHTGWGAYLARQGGGNPDGPPPDAGGDIAAMLRLWRYLSDAQRDLSGSAFRKLCQREYLNYLRVREWQDLVSQLRNVAKEMKMHATAEPAPTPVVLKCALAGLLSHVGALEARTGDKQRGPRQYLGARGAHFSIAPDSVLARAHPPLVVAVELVETSRLWAHGVGAVEASWVEEVGAPHLTRMYGEPYYALSARRAKADMRVSLFGVPLGTHRVDYASIDGPAARAILIQSGLVEGQMTARPGTPLAAVIEHNTSVHADLDALEIKARRRGLVVGDDVLAAWFDARLPAGATSGAALDAWLHGHPERASALMLTSEDLLAGTPPAAGDFPDRWTIGQASFGLDYRFTPGDRDDGVTVDVPLADLAGLPGAAFTWGVPGRRLELATALIRSLPKGVRRHVVPAPQYAAAALDWLAAHDPDMSRPFPDELSRALGAITGETIAGWHMEEVPDYLRPLFRVDDGVEAHIGRDLPAIQAELGRQVQASLSEDAARTGRTGTTWVFGTMPEAVVLRRGGISAPAHPALQDARTCVSEVFVPDLGQARRTHRAGLARLIALALPDPTQGVFAQLGRDTALALASSPYTSVGALLADARDAAIRGILDEAADAWTVREAAGFASLVAAARPRQAPAMARMVELAATCLSKLAGVERLLATFAPASPLVTDVTTQLDDIVFDGFLCAFRGDWLRRVPVWLDGVVRRLEVGLSDPARDERGMAEMAPVVEAYERLVRRRGLGDDEVERIGCLIEELRLQVFAQPVKTVQPVSVKRLLGAILAVLGPAPA